jgi:YD repeat-containing protein
MTRIERQWWGVVELAFWDRAHEMRAVASSNVDCRVTRDDAGRLVSVTLRWAAQDLDEALRRVRDAVGLDAAAFKSGYPLPL